MKKILFTETLKVVQLPVEDVIAEVGKFGVGCFEDRATFEDTNKILGEVLISIGEIDEMLDLGFSNGKMGDYLERLREAMNEAGASYVQIVKV